MSLSSLGREGLEGHPHAGKSLSKGTAAGTSLTLCHGWTESVPSGGSDRLSEQQQVKVGGSYERLTKGLF